MKTAPPKGLIIIIALLAMIGPFSVDTYLPSFPAIESEFSISRALLSQSIALYLATFAFSALIGSPIADWSGRRPVIIAGLIIYTLASLGCALSENYNQFLFGRLIQGIGAGVCLAVGRTITRDAYDFQNAQRHMSYIMSALCLAPAVAPIIGGWLHEIFGWRSIFYFLTLFGLFLLIVFSLLVPETHRPLIKKKFSINSVLLIYFATFTNLKFILLTAIITNVSGGLFIYLVGAPTVIFDFLKLDSNDFYALFMPIVVCMTLGAWISGKLSSRWDPSKTINISLSIMLVASLFNACYTLFGEQSLISTVIPLMLLALGIGIGGPVFVLLAIDCFPDNRGNASGVLGFVQTLGHALFTSVLLPIFVIPTNFAFGQFLLIISAVIFWAYLKKNGTQ